MASLTIHDIDSELAIKLDQAASESKKSKNGLIKELLSRALGIATDRGVYADDYSEFCGSWAAEEAAAFDAAQAGNSRVDPADWK